MHLGLETYSRQRNVQKDQQSTDSQKPTAGRETYRWTSRVQSRQSETYSKQRNTQKDQQSTDSQRPTADRGTY